MVSSYLPTSRKTLGNYYFKSTTNIHVPHNKDKVGIPMDEKAHLQYCICIWMKHGLPLLISFFFAHDTTGTFSLKQKYYD